MTEKRRTIQDWLIHFRTLYGERNECYFRGGLQQRIAFLHLAVDELARVIRQDEYSSMARALSRVLARTLTVADYFRELPLTECLASKYALGHCSYCGEIHCICGDDKRPPVTLGDAGAIATVLTFHGLATALEETYGPKNRERGVLRALLHLMEEVNEIGRIEYSLPVLPQTPAQMRRDFAFEVADCIAWTLAVSNLLGVDLDATLEARYGSVCWHCQHKPCDCLISTLGQMK